jgi:hypothetical protein
VPLTPLLQKRREIHVSQSSGFILLEQLAALMALALLAGIWAQLRVQLHLAEHRSIVVLQALHLATSYLDQLRASSSYRHDVVKNIDQCKLACHLQKVPHYPQLWFAVVEVVPDRYPECKVTITTCGAQES